MKTGEEGLRIFGERWRDVVVMVSRWKCGRWGKKTDDKDSLGRKVG